jgi:hypothetical protein
LRESEGAETLSETKSSSAASATGVSPYLQRGDRKNDILPEYRRLAGEDE